MIISQAFLLSLLIPRNDGYGLQLIQVRDPSAYSSQERRWSEKKKDEQQLKVINGKCCLIWQLFLGKLVPLCSKEHDLETKGEREEEREAGILLDFQWKNNNNNRFLLLYHLLNLISGSKGSVFLSLLEMTCRWLLYTLYLQILCFVLLYYSWIRWTQTERRVFTKLEGVVILPSKCLRGCWRSSVFFSLRCKKQTRGWPHESFSWC